MKIISTSSEYTIYEDDLKVYNELPAQYYTIGFHPMKGYFLLRHAPFEITERIYGVIDQKTDKVLNAFPSFNRSLGVILSGNKGIGKSLCAKMMCIKAHEKGMPVIIVEEFAPGIAQYISSIDQECVVLFDEFDKKFRSMSKSGDTKDDPQTSLLSLFDGIDQGKKLYIITCNELAGLNDFLVNRPGRFHYHFRFDVPIDNEIRQYMRDNLCDPDSPEIEKVVSFSKRVPLNFDCLRAIVFELNQGIDFSEAIKDLNILNVERFNYNLRLYMGDGRIFKSDACFSLYGNEDHKVGVATRNEDGRNEIDIIFDPSEIVSDAFTGQMYLPGDSIIINWKEDDEKEYTIQRMTITRQPERNIHYMV